LSPFKNIDKNPQYFVEGILEGDLAILSRAITLVESTKMEHKEVAGNILEGVKKRTGNSFRLGITGVPGVGKSTFIESFGKEVVKRGHRLAVLAVDPSSEKSKGSILGDKTRMQELSSLKNVFIRPSPSGGSLGGVARTTYETILLCEAAGYDYVIIETVGVGQSEVAVNKISDFFLLLMLAGAGDELQGIKRGIMEMADSVVITKADGNNVQKAKAAKMEYARALHMMQLPESGFLPKVEVCSALENKGISEVYDLIESYRVFTHANNYFLKKRGAQQFELLLSTIDEALKSAFYADETVASSLNALKQDLRQGNFLPFKLGQDLVQDFLDRR
jgi:LAO/AO transport system kinase